MFEPKTVDLGKAIDARDRAVAWLVDHVAPNGTPDDSDLRNGWMRLSWGLAVGGRPEVGAAVAQWIEINRLDQSGAFINQPLVGQPYIDQYPNYWLATFVIGAWLVGRTDLATRSMTKLASAQDTVTGGLPMSLAGRDGRPVHDIMSTAQVGLAALVVGEHEVAHHCARWVRKIAEQSAKESLTFHACEQGGNLCTEPDPAVRWASIIAFDEPRQAYYQPGMGAVFLARYSRRYGCAVSLESARRLLDFNLQGSDQQFADLDSVQACKFGWAVGEMHLADPDGGWLPWVKRMTQWFIERQSNEGSWGPSRFADANPTVADRLVKTAEHVMELSVLMAALATAQVD